MLDNPGPNRPRQHAIVETFDRAAWAAEKARVSVHTRRTPMVSANLAPIGVAEELEKSGMPNQQIFAGRLGIDSHGDSWLLETPGGVVLVDVTDFHLDDAALHEGHVVSIIRPDGDPNVIDQDQTHRPTTGRPQERSRARVRSVMKPQRFAGPSAWLQKPKGNCSASEASHATMGRVVPCPGPTYADDTYANQVA